MTCSVHPVGEGGRRWMRRERRRRGMVVGQMGGDLAGGWNVVTLFFSVLLILSNGGDGTSSRFTLCSLFFSRVGTAQAANPTSPSFFSSTSSSSSLSRSSHQHRRLLATTPNSVQDKLFDAIRNPRVAKFTIESNITFTASPPAIVNKDFRITGKCGEGRCVLDFAGFNGFQAVIAGPYPAKISLTNLELRNAVETALPTSAEHTNGTGTGAALYVKNADVLVRNCVFRHNSASFQGGAIFGDECILSVRDSYFCSNRAEEGSGGAVMLSGGSTGRFSNVYFGGNVAGANGGALHWYNSKDLAVLKSTFSENKAKKSGGAISLFNDDFVFPVSLNSIGFESNCACDHGGAVFLGVGYSTAAFCRNMYFNNTAALCSVNGTHPSSDSVFVTVSDQPLYWDIPQRVSFCPTKPEGVSFLATSSLIPQTTPAPSLNGTKIIESCEFC